MPMTKEARVLLDKAENGTEIYPEAERQAGVPAAELIDLARWLFRVSASGAQIRSALDAASQAEFDARVAEMFYARAAAVDAEQAGRTVTDLSVTVNSLRSSADAFRTRFDSIIAEYLTTASYHESHEAFVTSALLVEQFVLAMAEATTREHDILDDAVSSNTRIVAALTRAFADYGGRIAELPDSSFVNVGEQIAQHAEPESLAHLVTALLTVYGRVGRLAPEQHGLAYERFVGALDPAAIAVAGEVALGALGRGLRARPAVARAIMVTAARGVWTVLRSCVRRRDSV